MNRIPGILLVVTSIVIAVIFILTAKSRPLSGLENALFQILTLGIGLIGSYVLGRESAQKSAREMIKPHARSAFRRVVSLYTGLSRLGMTIQAAQRDAANGEPVLNTLEAIVIEQIRTADDALQDWKDVVPDDVEELYAQLKSRAQLEESK